MSTPLTTLHEQVAENMASQVSIVNTVEAMQMAVEEVKDPVKIISVMKKKSNKLSRMMRWQLLRFMKTLLVLRRCFLERNLAGLEDVQVILSLEFNPLNSVKIRTWSTQASNCSIWRTGKT